MVVYDMCSAVTVDRLLRSGRSSLRGTPVGTARGQSGARLGHPQQGVCEPIQRAR